MQHPAGVAVPELMRREGAMAMLRAVGRHPEVADDAARWLAANPRGLLVAGTGEVAAAAAAAPNAAIIALVAAPPDPATCRRLLAAGARGVAVDGMSTGRFAALADAVEAGFAVVPAQVAVPLATRLSEPPAGLEVTAADRRLLELTAAGRTAQQTAAAIGLSERQIRRRLRSLWDRLGAAGAADGLVRAARWGLVG